MDGGVFADAFKGLAIMALIGAVSVLFFFGWAVCALARWAF